MDTGLKVSNCKRCNHPLLIPKGVYTFVICDNCKHIQYIEEGDK